LKIYLRFLRRIIPSVLLAPIAPLLGWGPITHAYINEKTLEHLDKLGGIQDHKAASVLGKNDARDYFILTAGYPDIIKAKGFLKGDMSYDYAHNPLPNRYYGQPQFAIDLYRNSLDLYDDELLALALSWRAHQVSDVFAHHVPLGQYWGYANQAGFFEPFWNMVVKHVGEENLGDLPGVFYRADHWISELVIDLFCYLKMGSEWSLRMMRPTPDRPLRFLGKISRRYLQKHSDILRREYKNVSLIELNQIRHGKQFSDTLNSATCRYFNSLADKRKERVLLEMIRNHNSYASLEGMLDCVAYATAQSLVRPSDEWRAPKIDAEKFISGSKNYNDVFLGFVSEGDYDKYYSEEVENHWMNYQPHSEGLVRFVLQKIPISVVRLIVMNTPLITRGYRINRMLLPSGWNSYSLSLRYTFNLRERAETDFLTILKGTLEEANLIPPFIPPPNVEGE
jgi:hypothetical protein